MNKYKILIVEDELDILNLLKYNFQNEGYEVLTAEDGYLGLEIAEHQRPDLILLDILLPGKSGFQVCQSLKSKIKTKDIPIIMLTAKGEEKDRINGLELGADDYVVKPFSPKELVLRVKAVLKRSQKIEDKERVWQMEGLKIDFDAYQVLVHDKEIELTVTEFNLLKSLVYSEGLVLSREQLLDKVWGYEFIGYARTVDTHMHRLRQKLGDYSNYIQTVRGIGYRFRKIP